MKNKLLNKKGSVLIYTLILTGIISVISLSGVSKITSQVANAQETIDRIKADYTAEAGMEEIRYLVKDNIPAIKTVSGLLASKIIDSNDGSSWFTPKVGACPQLISTNTVSGTIYDSYNVELEVNGVTKRSVSKLKEKFTMTNAIPSSPIITSIDPLSAYLGESITINGIDFKEDGTVYFENTGVSSVSAGYQSIGNNCGASKDKLTVIIPANTPEGDIDIWFKRSDGKESNKILFNVKPKPITGTLACEATSPTSIALAYFLQNTNTGSIKRNGTKIADVSNNSGTITDTGLTPNTDYSYSLLDKSNNVLITTFCKTPILPPTLSLAKNPTAMAVNSAKNELYVMGETEISVVDLNTNKVLANIPHNLEINSSDVAYFHIAYSNSKNRIYMLKGKLDGVTKLSIIDINNSTPLNYSFIKTVDINSIIAQPNWGGFGLDIDDGLSINQMYIGWYRWDTGRPAFLVFDLDKIETDPVTALKARVDAITGITGYGLKTNRINHKVYMENFSTGGPFMMDYVAPYQFNYVGGSGGDNTMDIAIRESDGSVYTGDGGIMGSGNLRQTTSDLGSTVTVNYVPSGVYPGPWSIAYNSKYDKVYLTPAWNTSGSYFYVFEGNITSSPYVAVPFGIESYSRITTWQDKIYISKRFGNSLTVLSAIPGDNYKILATINGK